VGLTIHTIAGFIPAMSKNNFSRSTDMNVFGTSRGSETKKFISNLEQSIKSYSSKLVKFERLLEENQKSIQIQEEQTEALQKTCSDIAERISKLEKPLQDITEQLKKISKAVDTL